MIFLDRLERRLARFTIPGLMRYVVALNALAYILLQTHPSFGASLIFDRHLIMQGEAWRLVSWLFIPATSNPIWTLIYLYSIWWIGDLTESAWGTFRLNAYYFLGMALCALSAWIFGATDALSIMGGNTFLNLSVFLALATLMPNLEILLMFILPVKLKWAALISVAGSLAMVVIGSLSVKIIVLMCLGNYVLFFGPPLMRYLRDRSKVQIRRAQFEAASDASSYLHRCEACGITELTHPYADFRVTDDGREYCMEHLPSQLPLAGTPRSHS